MNPLQTQIRLKAQTLMEVLVAMIIGGIIFLSIMDGMILFRQYAASVTERMESNIGLYDSYYRLETLVSNSDSILDTGRSLEIYTEGNQRYTLKESDSLILLSQGDFSDTLFIGMSIIPVFNKNNPRWVDALCLMVPSEDSVYRFCFATGLLDKMRIKQTIDQLEEEYQYE